METMNQMPQKNNRKSLALVFLGLLALLVVIVLLVTAPQRKQKKLDQMEQDTTQEIREDVVMVPAGPAQVQSVNVEILESFPLQARAVVAGVHPDGCTSTVNPTVAFDDLTSTFALDIQTQKPQDAMCTQVMTPFSEIIPLDIAGLPAGEYTVTVNGEQATFVLMTDNELDFELDKG